jgi:hypothetical protein
MLLLATVLVIGGLTWAWQIHRRPGHRRRELFSPLLMIAAGLLLLGGFATWLGLW